MAEVRALILFPGHCPSRGPWQEVRGPVFTAHSPGCCHCVRHADQMPALTCAHTERHVLHGLYFRAFVTGEGHLAAGQECKSNFVRCLRHFQIYSLRLREETAPVQVSFLTEKRLVCPWSSGMLISNCWSARKIQAVSANASSWKWEAGEGKWQVSSGYLWKARAWQ